MIKRMVWHLAWNEAHLVELWIKQPNLKNKFSNKIRHKWNIRWNVKIEISVNVVILIHNSMPSELFTFVHLFSCKSFLMQPLKFIKRLWKAKRKKRKHTLIGQMWTMDNSQGHWSLVIAETCFLEWAFIVRFIN